MKDGLKSDAVVRRSVRLADSSEWLWQGSAIGGIAAGAIVNPPNSCRLTSIPMLCATEPGAAVTLEFTGSAVGAYVVAGPDAGIVEVRPKLEGMNMFVIFAPKKKPAHSGHKEPSASHAPPRPTGQE